MNSEFVAQRSDSLAKTLLEKASASQRDRVESAIRKVLNRPADPAEVDAAVAYIDRFRERFGKTPEQALGSYCKILLASNDFAYVF